MKKQLYPISNHILNNYSLIKNNVISFKKKPFNNSQKNTYKNNFNIKFTSILSFNNNIILFYISNYYNINTFIMNIFVYLNMNFKYYSVLFLDIFKRTFGDGFLYLRGLFILFFIDACLTDDEPI